MMRAPPLLLIILFLLSPMALALGPGPDRECGFGGYNDHWQPDVDTTDGPLPWWERTSRDMNRNRIADSLDDLMLKGKLNGLKADLIVSYDRDTDERDLLPLKRFGEGALNRIEAIDAVIVAEVPFSMIPNLLELDGVVFIDPIGSVLLFSDIANPTIRAKGSRMFSPETAWDLGYTGRGVSISIVDTGIDDEHPSLTGKFLGGADMTKPDNLPFLYPQDGTYNPDDIQGHGSTCAGIAVGTGSPEQMYQGPGFDARLVDIRIGTKIGYAPGEFWIGALAEPHLKDGAIRGIQWGIENVDTSWASGGEEYRGIDIMSLSWGIDIGQSSDGTDPYSRLLDQAVEAGAVVVNAAGNDGPVNDGFHALSASSEAIIVAATDDMDTLEHFDDGIAVYSSRGPRLDNGDGNPYDELIPDVAAPGTHINNLQPDTTRLVGDASSNGYGPRGSGTSYATPLVAGLISLMLEANPGLEGENDLVKEILRYTAERKKDPTYPDLDPFWEADFGYGVVDAYNAVRLSEQVEDPSGVDVDLQAHITGLGDNLTLRSFMTYNTTLPVTVSGLAWSRGGNYIGSEYRIDDGPWKTISEQKNDTFNPWEVSVSGLSKGYHRIWVRSLSGDKSSLPCWIDIQVTEVSGKEGGIAGSSVLLPVLLIAIAAGAAAYLIWKRMRGRKDLTS